MRKELLMIGRHLKGLALLLPVAWVLLGCASAKVDREGEDPNLLTREQIMETGATNLYDVVHRLRPRWLQVRGTRSFNLETEILVLQNDMLMGGPEALKQMSPELAYQIEYLDGARAAAAIPGSMTGRHVEGAIIVRTRPRT